MTTKRVLVVDDSALVRRIARRMLEELGFTVAESVDGVAALKACAEGMPDCVLLDWNMPEMNGIEFLRKLRKEPAGEAPIVIFCTSEDSFDNITEALEAGANEYIIKPFDAPLLESKLVQAGVL
jgi:two-component system chemotaxis response regulator CheY